MLEDFLTINWKHWYISENIGWIQILVLENAQYFICIHWSLYYETLSWSHLQQMMNITAVHTLD